jgi:hypothetical protein
MRTSREKGGIVATVSAFDTGQDFLSVHRHRNPKSPAQIETRTRDLLVFAEMSGRPAPVHHQEPFRGGYGGWEPTADDFLADFRGAIAGGAAGWCFHNGSQRAAPENRPRRSFDLRQRFLFEQLDSEELKFVAGSRAALQAAQYLQLPQIRDDLLQALLVELSAQTGREWSSLHFARLSTQ